MSNKFTVYWRDGSRSVLSGGNTISEAFTAAGYGAGAVHAVDWYENGENDDYVWDSEKKRWNHKTPLAIETIIAEEQNKFGYGIDMKTVFTEMPKVYEDEFFITQAQADAITAKTAEGHTGKYKLFVSYNLDATYTCEHSSDDKDDPEMKRLIHIAQQRSNRYYVEGDDSVVCKQHTDIINFLGGSHQQRTIEEQAALLRNKFKPR
jgi:hypothetical protein